jgi:hypothetical protein
MINVTEFSGIEGTTKEKKIVLSWNLSYLTLECSFRYVTMKMFHFCEHLAE